MELPVCLGMAPYNHYEVADLTLGPYQMPDTYYPEWFATTKAKPVAEITLEQRARVLKQLRFNQKAYKSYLGPDEEVLTALASNQIVAILAHLNLNSCQIDLSQTNSRLKVIKVGLQSPWALECETSRNSSLAKFLLLLSQRGQELLDNHAVNYSQYHSFVSSRDRGAETLTVRFYGSERINRVLDKHLAAVISDVIIQPRAIWPSESSVGNTNQKVENYHLTMMVRLISCQIDRSG